MLITFNELSEIRKKRAEKSIVLVGGCYDLLHIGHIKFLEKCKKLGDILVVNLSSDERIRERKGNTRPIIKEEDRVYLLNSLRIVDYALVSPSVINKQISPTRLVINELKPNIFATNDIRFSDYKLELNILGTTVVYVEPVPADSTTDIIARICHRYQNENFL